MCDVECTISYCLWPPRWETSARAATLKEIGYQVRVGDDASRQNLEGEIDTAHVNFLHRNLDDLDDEGLPQEFLPPKLEENSLMPPAYLARKQFDLAETDFGFVAMARSDFPNGDLYWRMTPFLVPSFTLISSNPPWKFAPTRSSLLM